MRILSAFIFLLFIFRGYADDVCVREKKALMHYQEKMMKFENGGTSYQELLAQKNNLNADIAITTALLGIINDYYNYLATSQNLDVQKIDQMQLFLQFKAPAAHRMHVASDMINTVSAGGDLPNPVAKRRERFNLIKNRLQKRCQSDPNTSFCRNLGSQFWNGLDSENRTHRSATMNQAMVENFIHLASAANSIGKDIIDNSNLDQALASDPNNMPLITQLAKATDHAAKACANRDLLQTVAQDCLDIKLTDVQGIQQGHIERELRSSTGDPTLKITTLEEALKIYVNKVKQTAQQQVNLNNSALSQVIQKEHFPDFLAADQSLQEEAPRTKREFDQKKNRLAGNIHGAFKIMFAQRSLDHALTNGLSMQTFNPRASQLVGPINEQMRRLTGYQGNDLFTEKNGRIHFDPQEMATLLGTDALSSRAVKEKHMENFRRLEEVQAKLEALKSDPEFAALDNFRTYTWQNVRRKCSPNSDEFQDPSSCRTGSAYGQGLNILLETNRNIEVLDKMNSSLEELESILEQCTGDNPMVARHTCDQARRRKSARVSQVEGERRRAAEEERRRQELLSDYTHYNIRDEEGKIIGQRERINGFKVGAQRGLGKMTQILLPTALQYMALGPQLKMAAYQGKQEKTYQAWLNRPQYDCRVYVCNTNTYYYPGTTLGLSYVPTQANVIAGPGNGYQPFPPTNFQLNSTSGLANPNTAPTNPGFSF